MASKPNTKLIALLRGINVGGHHKVSMAQLKQELEKLGCAKIVTLLNSGNVIFEIEDKANLESKIETHLHKAFGFPIPVLLRDFEKIVTIVKDGPFDHIEVTDDTRLYVSFVKTLPETTPSLPYLSQDESFQVIAVKDKTIFSIVDLSKGKTVKGMEDLERLFGKDITTRNWNTIVKLANK